MVGASLLGRIRLFRADEPPAPRPAALPLAADGPELGDGDLEHVVGGLERVYVSGAAGD